MQKSKAKKTNPAPDVGDVVLFRVDKASYRPMLVVTVHDEKTISGELYVAVDDNSDWVRRNFGFNQPTKDHHSRWVECALKGTRMGQWKPKGNGTGR